MGFKHLNSLVERLFEDYEMQLYRTAKPGKEMVACRASLVEVEPQLKKAQHLETEICKFITVEKKEEPLYLIKKSVMMMVPAVSTAAAERQVVVTGEIDSKRPIKQVI